MKDQILKGMAKAFFASAYADQADECGQPLHGEIMDQLPDDIDPAALHAANTLANDMVWKSSTNNLDGLYLLALRQDSSGADRELTPELFGHYCAMQAMGHGVGLDSFGQAVYDAIKVPYIEFGSYSLEKDYFTPQDDE